MSHMKRPSLVGEEGPELVSIPHGEALPSQSEAREIAILHLLTDVLAEVREIKRLMRMAP